MERKDKHLHQRSLAPDRWMAFYTGALESPDTVLGLPVVSYKRRMFKNKPSGRCRVPKVPRHDRKRRRAREKAVKRSRLTEVLRADVGGPGEPTAQPLAATLGKQREPGIDKSHR